MLALLALACTLAPVVLLLTPVWSLGLAPATVDTLLLAVTLGGPLAGVIALHFYGKRLERQGLPKKRFPS